MSVDLKRLVEGIEKAKNNSKKRNFTQSVDLIVNLRDVDPKKPEHRMLELIELPNPVSKDVKVCVIGSGQFALEAKRLGADKVIEREELEALAKNKKMARKLAQSYDFFIAEAPLMPLIGRALGSLLGPRGKMPTPVPSNASLNEVLDKHKKLVRIRVRDQPTIQCRVGVENMDSEKIAENILTILRKIEEKFGSLARYVSSILVKTTMGKPVKIEVGKRR
ncbi:50S ribosomal protein L1 [Candidatus Bathyarchaeota archaeon]|nr:MAG: 50S ribosomal protein L1 [Candidatus Bathyarchaeota archaeon]